MGEEFNRDGTLASVDLVQIGGKSSRDSKARILQMTPLGAAQVAPGLPGLLAQTSLPNGEVYTYNALAGANSFLIKLIPQPGDFFAATGPVQILGIDPNGNGIVVPAYDFSGHRINDPAGNIDNRSLVGLQQIQANAARVLVDGTGISGWKITNNSGIGIFLEGSEVYSDPFLGVPRTKLNYSAGLFNVQPFTSGTETDITPISIVPNSAAGLKGRFSIAKLKITAKTNASVDIQSYLAIHDAALSGGTGAQSSDLYRINCPASGDDLSIGSINGAPVDYAGGGNVNYFDEVLTHFDGTNWQEIMFDYTGLSEKPSVDLYGASASGFFAEFFSASGGPISGFQYIAQLFVELSQ